MPSGNSWEHYGVFLVLCGGGKKVYGVQSKPTTVLQCHYSNNVIVHLFNFRGIKVCRGRLYFFVLSRILSISKCQAIKDGLRWNL